MDAFLENKKLYFEFKENVPEDMTEAQVSSVFSFLKYIRFNIDLADQLKILLTQTMVEFAKKQRRMLIKDGQIQALQNVSIHKYVRDSRVNIARLREYCFYSFARYFRRMCGSTLFQHRLFLRHFPSHFALENSTVHIHTLNMYSLDKIYKTIIRKPLYLFDEGVLPSHYQSPFRLMLVEDQQQGDDIARTLQDFTEILAINFQGYRIGNYGLITLVSVAGNDRQVYIFDVLKCPYFLKEGVLRTLFESDRMTKITHSLHWLAINLKRQFNVNLNHVYDTQVCFRDLEKRYPDLRLSFDGSISEGQKGRVQFHQLCGIYEVIVNNFNDVLIPMKKDNPSMWCYRPLCQVMLHIAGESVHGLLKLYRAMNNCERFKTNIPKIFYQTQRFLNEINTHSSDQDPWKIPDMPEPKTVVRGIRERHSNPRPMCDLFVDSNLSSSAQPEGSNAATNDQAEEHFTSTFFKPEKHKADEHSTSSFIQPEEHNAEKNTTSSFILPDEHETTKHDTPSFIQPEEHPISSSIQPEDHHLHKREVRIRKSSAQSQRYLINREGPPPNRAVLISSESNTTPQQYSPRYNDPGSFTNNPVSGVESSCLLVFIIGFFFIVLFKWFKFWKNRATLYQQKKCQEGLIKRKEQNEMVQVEMTRETE